MTPREFQFAQRLTIQLQSGNLREAHNLVEWFSWDLGTPTVAAIVTEVDSMLPREMSLLRDYHRETIGLDY